MAGFVFYVHLCSFCIMRQLLFALLGIAFVAFLTGCGRKMQSGISWGGGDILQSAIFVQDEKHAAAEPDLNSEQKSEPVAESENDMMTHQPIQRRLFLKAALKHSANPDGLESLNKRLAKSRFKKKTEQLTDQPNSSDAAKKSGDKSWLGIVFAGIMLFLLWFVLKAFGVIEFSFLQFLGSLLLMLLFIALCAG